MTFHRPLDAATSLDDAATPQDRLPWPRAALVLGLVSLGLWTVLIAVLRSVIG